MNPFPVLVLFAWPFPHSPSQQCHMSLPSHWGIPRMFVVREGVIIPSYFSDTRMIFMDLLNSNDLSMLPKSCCHLSSQAKAGLLTTVGNHELVKAERWEVQFLIETVLTLSHPSNGRIQNRSDQQGWNRISWSPKTWRCLFAISL